MATALQRWFLILVLALAALAQNGQGQSSVHWSYFKVADGLSAQVFSTISLTPQDKLVAANFNEPLASELDGYSVTNFPAPPVFIERIRESPGGQRWALATNGLLEFKDNGWQLHPVPEIAAEFQSPLAPSETAPPFFPVRQGCVMVLLPDRLIEFSTEDPDQPRTTVIRDTAQTRIGPFTGMAMELDGTLWICGVRGIAKGADPARNINPQTQWQEFVPPAALQFGNLSAPELDEDGGITLIGESLVNHQKAAMTFDGNQWMARPSGSENFIYAWRGAGRSFWAATSESLFQWDEARTNWVEDDEISVGRIFDVAIEPGGAFWLATSGGLIRGSAALWQKPEAIREVDSPVQCLTADSDGRIYFISDNALHVLENGRHRQFPLPSVPPNSSAVYRLFPMVNFPLMVQAGDALFQFERENGSFQPMTAPPGQRAIPLGYTPAGGLCFYLPGANPSFDEYDGKYYPLKGAPTERPDAVFTTCYAAHNGDFWLGGESDVLWRHGDQWQSLASKDQTGPAMAVGFAEMPDGSILCATRSEIWEFNGKKNWLLLQDGFNHINGLAQSHDGSIWIASNGGLFRFYKDAWLENGTEEGLPGGPVHAICEDASGQIRVATAHGVSRFHPEADLDPPQTFIRRLAGEDGQLSEGGSLSLLLEGHDKWKTTSPDRLLYSYQLDQSGWSPFRNISTPTFSYLAAGRHYFQVRALDPAGNQETTPAALDFTVTVPWFKEGRLWMVLAPGVALVVFFASVAWNRHRQLVLSHAAVEKKVAERTRELEIATRELLHSQKMNALGTLAAGIAHDFNNILSIIKGSAQIIEDNPGQPEKIRTRVDRIKTVVSQGAEIVDAMLGFSRGSDALPSPCDVNVVVTDTMKLLGDRFLREVEVKFERAEKLPEIVAPREFIQQILLNFIFNAAEAMNGHKEIILATGLADKLPPDIFLAPASSASFVLVSVRDIGSGIAPEIISRIFEPFFTTKAFSARRGTGLGLSMVYELAKKMDAGLSVQSVVGRGSTFTLILPVANPNGAKTAPVNSP